MKGNRGHIRQWYTDLSFKKKLLSISLGICVFPVILLQIIFTQTSISNMNKQINEQIHNNLVQISEKFTLKMESYEDMVYQVYSDKEIINSLEKYPTAGKMEGASLFYFLNERMKQFAEKRKGVRSISLICSSGESLTYDNQSGSALDNIWRDYPDLRMIEPYQLTQGRNEIVLIPTRVISNQEKSEALFFLGKELYNTDNLQQGVIGTLIICIEEQELNEICNGARNQEYQENSITFITDSGGTVLSFPNQNMIGTIVTDEQNEIDFIHEAEIFSSKNLNSSSYQDEKTGWIRKEKISTKKAEDTSKVNQKVASTKKVQETSRGASTSRSNTTKVNTPKNTEKTSNVTETKTTEVVATQTSSKGNEIVTYAKQYLGYKYVYGGTTPNGFDCSGFTQYVYKHFGITLNRTAAAQYSNGKSVSNLQAGDLVMFGKSGINHVGIYIGGNSFVHAANKKSGVRIDTLSSGYYKTNYVGARRIF